ncbi:MAG: ABC transporter permease subunit, partial [Anaerolineaceae bacterium]|nr:ABC transporter permease subunit [Anaerolineaceae bacterium]
MYTATNAGRMILVEKRQGTLPRLLVSPTTGGQVLAGKMVGSYMTGALQMLILIAAST